MTTTACLIRGVLGAAGIALVATQSSLWLILAGVTLAVMAALRPRVDVPSSSIPVADDGRLPMFAGLLLAVAGAVLLAVNAGWATPLHEIPGRLIGGTPEPSVLGAAVLLPAGILMLVGLLAAGGLSPLAAGMVGMERFPWDVFPRAAAVTALIRVVALTLAPHESRLEVLLIAMTLVGWIAAIVRRDEPAGRRDLLLIPSLMWLTGACVAAWEAGSPQLAGRSGMPSVLHGIWLCMIADALASLAVTAAESAGERAVWLRRLGLLALSGVPPFPAFWGRLWILTALMFAHPIEPMTDLPDVHYGLMLVALTALFGLWSGFGRTLLWLRDPSMGTAISNDRSRLSLSVAVVTVLLLLAIGLFPRLLLESWPLGLSISLPR